MDFQFSSVPKKDLRKFRRVPCSFEVILESAFEKIEAKCVDISERGIRLSLSRIPQVSSEFDLVFKTGSVLEGVNVMVRLVWLNEAVGSDRCLAGFSFLKNFGEDYLKICGFIQGL